MTRTHTLRVLCPDCQGSRVTHICGPVDTHGENEDLAFYREGDAVTCRRCDGRGVIYIEEENE